MCQAEELLVLVFGKFQVQLAVYQPSARSLSWTAQASPTFSTVRTEGAAQVDKLVALSRGAFAGLEKSCPGVSDIDVHALWAKLKPVPSPPNWRQETVLELLCFQPQTPLPVVRGRGDTVMLRFRQARLAAGKQLRGSRAATAFARIRESGHHERQVLCEPSVHSPWT